MKVAVIMGSKNDMPVLEPTIKTLKDFGAEVEMRVISAHRTPDIAHDFGKNAQSRGIEVIIAAAGKAAHLAGVMAGLTIVPVIGLPIKSSTMDGLDSLLSTVQMPEGIPVATVAINGAQNAALLAVQMLALKYPELNEKLTVHRAQMAEKIINQDNDIQ